MADNIRITSSFWGRYRGLVRTEMIPFQWSVLNDQADIVIEKERNDDSIPNEKSHAIANFKIAAGREKGTHYGWTFQDSDVYKWLEAVAYSLREKMNPELEAKALQTIDLIADAQEEDGYLDTYFSILGLDSRYKRLAGSHELYCMGHFIEAAVAYHEATGNEKVLSVARKCADNIDANFGPEEGKIHGYDGHEEIEIGLLRLYRVTEEKRYLNLAKYFLLERGKNPQFFKEQAKEYDGPNALNGIENLPDTYFQNHKPILQQETAEGHAVRLVYMCTALADLAAETGDKEIFAACKRLWKDVVERRMFITGGIGSTVIGESFTLDYDLPNDTMYCETCAAIGLIFFARQMLRIEPNSEYAEVMERALYNCALAGMALDGKHFFYVNPLEVNPKKSKADPTKSHVKPVRPAWLGCACCPPNLARMITSLDDYIYTVRADGILLNQYIDSDSHIKVANNYVEIVQETEFPWDESVRMTVKNSGPDEIKFGVRIPSWAKETCLIANGKEVSLQSDNGYHYVTLASNESIELLLTFKMDITRYYCNPLVSENNGKVAIGRGPFVYCLEGVDNGENLNNISLPADNELTFHFDENLLNGVGVIEGAAKRLVADYGNSLYSTNTIKKEDTKIKLIPYYAWANRGENEMQVWIRE